MSVVSIIAGIKAEVETALSTFTELTFGTTVEKNSKRVLSKRYSVLPGAVTEVDSVTKAITTDQTFELILTDVFVPSATSDSDKRTVTNVLFDNIHTAYKRLVNEKVGVPSSVLLVSDLGIDVPEYVEDKDMVILRSSFNIKYRQSL